MTNVERRRARFGRAGFALALLVPLALTAAPLHAQEAGEREALPDGLVAADAFAPDEAEPGSVERIEEYTTAEEFLPRSVSYVPESDAVPSPTDVLGHLAGAPDRLSGVDVVHGYFHRLAAASDRVTVRTIGESEEGREILLAAVSSEENLADLDRLKAASGALADPRETDRAEMKATVADAVPFYYLLAGLHSTETGSPEMVMELAYRLAVSEREEIREIRDGLVVLITPVVEPDGRDRMVQWYERHLRERQDELPFDELRDFSSPPYWGHYVFHDNNRDGMQLTQALTRAVHEAYYEHHPVVVHDLHESLPLLYISTGHGPYNRAIDPVTINEWTQFAHHEAGALQAQGLPGVWVWGFWDGWWPGYLFSVANNHNAMGRFYETFGNSLAGTFRRHLEEREFVGKSVVTRQWYRPEPPDSTVTWSLRNNTNYMQAGTLEALHYSALHGPELLENFWVKGRRSLERGRSEPPHAFAFPEAQRDPARLAHMVNLLGKHRIEVHRLSEPFAAGDSTLPAGTWVVRMDQPYRDAALMLLERQEFPEDVPTPYDDVAWTWPLLIGVEGGAVDDAAILEAAMEPVEGPVAAPGSVEGEGDLYLLADRGQTSLLAAREWLGGARVEAAEEPFEADGREYPAGSWIVDAPRDRVERIAAGLGLRFVAADEAPEVARHRVDLPRLGLYVPWTSTQDAGWARYTLDRDGIAYDLLVDDDLREGRLRGQWDVIVIPDVWGDFARLVHGIDPRYGPLAYTRTDRYPSHGTPVASDDITGGMGFEGLRALQRFVERGGTLVAIADGGRLVVDGGIVRHVGHGGGEEVRTPGSELRAKVLRPDHPLAYGYEEETSVFRGNDPIWTIGERYRDRVVVQLGTKEVEDWDARDTRLDRAETADPTGEARPVDFGIETGREGDEADDEGEADDDEEASALVLSGGIEGAEKVDGEPAILDLPVGEGRVVLFSFNPLHRYLNLSDFRFATNAILHWDDMPAAE